MFSSGEHQETATDAAAQHPAVAKAARLRRHALAVGAAYYALTTCVVILGAGLGTYALVHQPSRGFLRSFAHVDGVPYVELANWGYTLQAARPPYIAYFPFYPLLGRAIKDALGIEAETGLLLLSHASLLAAFVVMARYLAARWPHAPSSLTSLTLLALGLWPATFFFRMAYSESLFLAAALLAMYAMERRWSLPLVALVVGFATGVRPVGVALVPVFALHVWRSSTGPGQFLTRAVLLLPLASWGLVAYMIYLQGDFGDPLGFATAQRSWVLRPTPWLEKLPALLTLEPLWSPYVPGSVAYWRSHLPADQPWLNFALVNPLVFVVTVALLVTGAVKRWLNGGEIVLGGLLLLIPYVTMAHDNLMTSQPRFAAVIFPAYMVMARLLWPLPRWAIAVFFITCAMLLGVYAAYFTAGYGSIHRAGGAYRIFF